MSRETIRQANSPNHERDGQNVMLADGSVQFYNAPFVGVGYDNVYTAKDGGDRPKDKDDTVLLPTWSQGPQLLPQAATDRRWVFAIACVVTLLVVGWVVRKGLRNDKSGPLSRVITGEG